MTPSNLRSISRQLYSEAKPRTFADAVPVVRPSNHVASYDSIQTATLYDYKTGEALRPATQAEVAASRNAGNEGVIKVDGRSCYAQP